MILVAGLGNPGDRYELTRHNIGFLVVDALAARSATTAIWRSHSDGDLAQVDVAGSRLLLLKPQTFMNHSGRSIRGVASYFKLEVEQVLVVHDELDLPFGRLRMKLGGGDAGHRGVRSTAAEMGSKDFARLRVGIGRPPVIFEGTVADYVLQAFALPEREELPSVLDRAVQAVTLVAERGLAEAMNITNQC
ncbi:MAG: aminoacyl-tRNA hydrolase [Polyangiaceae bacterium]|nr:aminoacyl-tRNA hydrolase [Myxococcales bacterium]MCB9586292.1 aminoacyl-tRNA hydrolase [Polyangiaceae bacterium]MCB9606969.1 aminoacyl-tRNA hydrolase [Polyangiaceae bacterium]